MASSKKAQNVENSLYKDDRVIQNINKYVSLKSDEKKQNTEHMERAIKRGLIPRMQDQDPLLKKKFPTIMHGGSYYKQTKVGKPLEYDLDLVINLPWVEESLTIESRREKPGYVKIKVGENSNLPDWEIQHFKSLLAKFVDGNNYMDQNKFRAWMESVIGKTFESLDKVSGTSAGKRLLTVEKLDYIISYKKSGPAFTFKIEVPEGHSIDVDLVACLQFTIPPPEKYTGFKEKKNWLVVPKPLPKEEEEENLMWRLCFYQHEKELVKGEIKTLIRLIKKLRDKEDWKNLSSYFIESLALAELDSIKDPFFKNQSRTNLFMRMLERLRDATEKHFIPFYWYKDMNLLEKLGKDQIKNINSRLKVIMSKIEKSIQIDGFIIAKFILKENEFGEMLEKFSDKSSQDLPSPESQTEPKMNLVEISPMSSANSSQLYIMDKNLFQSPEDSKEDKIIRMLLEIKEEIREIKDVVQDLSKKVDNLEKNKVPLSKIHPLIDIFPSNMTLQ